MREASRLSRSSRPRGSRPDLWVPGEAPVLSPRGERKERIETRRKRSAQGLNRALAPPRPPAPPAPHPPPPPAPARLHWGPSASVTGRGTVSRARPGG